MVRLALQAAGAKRPGVSRLNAVGNAPAPSESDDPASPASAERTLDYARKTWRNAPFDEADIEREEVKSQRVTLTVPLP
jgi:hypothetical protein